MFWNLGQPTQTNKHSAEHTLENHGWLYQTVAASLCAWIGGKPERCHSGDVLWMRRERGQGWRLWAWNSSSNLLQDWFRQNDKRTIYLLHQDDTPVSLSFPFGLLGFLLINFKSNSSSLLFPNCLFLVTRMSICCLALKSELTCSVLSPKV